MKCMEAQGEILEAGLPVLRGEGDDPLALHIRSCEKCQKVAETILEGEARLAESLSAALPSPSLELILQRAGVPELGIPEEEGSDGLVAPSLDRRRPRWSRFRTASTLIPLAAAAALTLLFLGRSPDLPGPDYAPIEGAPGLDVEVPQGRSVAVLETNNPKITVLWLFEGD